MAARPIGGHENLWNGKMVATKAREAPDTIWTAREAAEVSESHVDGLQGPIWIPRLQRATWTAGK